MIEEMAVNEPLREWITRFAEEKIEDNKRWDIREISANWAQRFSKSATKA